MNESGAAGVVWLIPAIVAALVAVSCRPAADQASSEAEAVASVSDSAATADSPAAPGVTADGSARAVRVLPVLLVNRHSGPLIVRASAGATPVLVDTIGASDSSRVNLEVRADSLRLTIFDAEGPQLSEYVLHAATDTLRRLELP